MAEQEVFTIDHYIHESCKDCYVDEKRANIKRAAVATSPFRVDIYYELYRHVYKFSCGEMCLMLEESGYRSAMSKIYTKQEFEFIHRLIGSDKHDGTIGFPPDMICVVDPKDLIMDMLKRYTPDKYWYAVKSLTDASGLMFVTSHVCILDGDNSKIIVFGMNDKRLDLNNIIETHSCDAEDIAYFVLEVGVFSSMSQEDALENITNGEGILY